MTSGLEGAWTQTPTAWSILFFNNLLTYTWQKHETPAGATLWIPTDKSAHTAVADAHIKGKRNSPVMLTTDMALKKDPGFRKISRAFSEEPESIRRSFRQSMVQIDAS